MLKFHAFRFFVLGEGISLILRFLFCMGYATSFILSMFLLSKYA